ncbi:MAG: SEL1-like repeat protein [Campylobacterales bacterium]|nr:SEL1-like repeat protein [Campylobacterales bacterium]
MDELTEGINAYTASDFAKAHEILYPLAMYQRNDEAQFYMGMLYFYGEGVDKDVDKAMEWWKKAMKQGNRDAAYRLSEIKTSTKTTF